MYTKLYTDIEVIIMSINVAFKKFLNILDETDVYPTLSKLRYKYGFNQSDLDLIQSNKLSSSLYTVLPLRSETDIPLHFLFTEQAKKYLLGSVDMISESKIEELNQINNQDIVNRFIYSEIENSLLIEGVHSSRKKIDAVIDKSYDDLETENQIVIKNMIEGYNFVLSNEISESNIFELYSILSYKCLKEDEKLLEVSRYRHDHVGIVNAQGVEVDKGVSHKKLSFMMEDLIKYIRLPKESYEHLLAPYIIHYYMVYLHPYFDYNGRMARVMAFWYTLRHIPSVALLITSQAINNPKNKKYYYKAIEYSRKTENDITYFIEYLSKIGYDTTIDYINYYSIVHQLEGNGVILSKAEQLALRTVLSIEAEGQGFFTWRTYELYDFEGVKKQYILRLLNKLHSLKVLNRKTQKGAYLYQINKKRFGLI